VMLRLEADQFDRLDRWIARQGEVLSRPEAIRRLAKIGLKAKR
jgi:hypothetical protein